MKINSKGKRGEINESPGQKVTLSPGHRLEAYLSDPVKLADGTIEQRRIS